MRRIFRALFPVLFPLALLLILPGCSIVRWLAPEPAFIRLQDGLLYEDETPYTFAGVNLWYGPWLAADDTGGGDRAFPGRSDRRSSKPRVRSTKRCCVDWI